MQPIIRVFMFVIAINIFLYIGGVRVIADNDVNANFMSRFVNSDNTSVSNNLSSVVPTYNNANPLQQETGAGGFFTFIDTLKAIGSFVVFLVNIIFTPFGLFLGAGLPYQVGLMLGIPLMIAMVFGIIFLIRSGS